MRRLVQTALFTALAACCASTLAASAEQAPSGRLPGWAQPQSYQLAFKVDPAQADFSGTTTIEVKLAKASDHLWLDGADLKVSPAEEKNALEAARLVLDVGADVNAANDAGQTSLHAAAAIGANGVVRFLVERGARLDARTRQGRTPLDEALRGVPNIDGAPGEPHEDTAALLQELMAQRGIAVTPPPRAAAVAAPVEP